MEGLLLIDNWSGFADLLAGLIEKYAAVLDIDNLPEPPVRLEENEIERENSSKHLLETIAKEETT